MRSEIVINGKILEQVSTFNNVGCEIYPKIDCDIERCNIKPERKVN